jgi:integrase
VGFVRERTGTNGGTRYQSLYDDVKGHRRSAGTFVTETEAVRAWQRAEDRQADGRGTDTRRTRQRFRRYVEDVWLPHHEMEARTRETYTYYLDKHVLPVFGSMRINEIQPADVREWVSDLKAAGASPSVIRQCHTILSAVFTTAFNDQITRLHPCRGVKTPPVAKKLRTIITPDQFDQLYTALPSDTARLMAEVLVESGLRWAELIELHPADLNSRMRMLTVSRVAVELVAKFHPTGGRFLIKDYPKDREHRRIKLAQHVADQLLTHITEHSLGPDDLLFTPTLLLTPTEPAHLQLVAGPDDLGLTEPNAADANTGTAPSPATTPADASVSTAAVPTPPTAPNDEQPARTPTRPLGPPATEPSPPTATSPAPGSATTSGNPPSTPPVSASASAPTTCATPTPPGSSPAAPTSKQSRNG